MLRESLSPGQGTSVEPLSLVNRLQTYISQGQKLAKNPALARDLLVERIKAASATNLPSSRLSFQAFADGLLHLVNPRFLSHLLIVLLTATVAIVGGLRTIGRSGASSSRPWQFEPFAVRSLVSGKDFLEEPALTATIKPVRGRDAIVTYEAVAGDTLTGIAEKFGISVESIISANNLDDADSLSIGDKLAILPISGLLHTVQDGDTIESIAVKYQVDPSVIAKSDYNQLSEPYQLFIGQKLIVPGGTMPAVTRPAPTARGGDRPREADPQPALPPAASSAGRGGSQFSWPVVGPITQGYSSYHLGLDIGPPYGTTIYAANNGVVIGASFASDWGLNVLIDHGGGLTSRYAHASKLLVSPGQQVSRGQPIALVGATGRATGPHLHFEIYQNGVRINPLRYLP